MIGWQTLAIAAGFVLVLAAAIALAAILAIREWVEYAARQRALPQVPRAIARKAKR